MTSEPFLETLRQFATFGAPTTEFENDGLCY